MPLPSSAALALAATAVVAVAGAGVSAPTPPPSTPSFAPAPQGTSSAVWPLEPPRVVAPFEAPAGAYAAGHRGVDLAGVAGQRVRSATAGTVAVAGPVAGVPVVVVAMPDGRRVTYQPVLTDLAVGDRVDAGTALGVLAGAPSHCAPAACLHWGLYRGRRRDGLYLDPLTLVDRGPVRLLPTLG